MKLIMRHAKPKNDKEAMLRLEAPIDDVKDPGVAYITIGDIEYLVEIYYTQAVS
jgi:hypothetical protein